MTYREFHTLLNEIIDKDDIKLFVTTKARRLIKSGAIDLEHYKSDDYGIVKTILSVCIESLAFQYAPPDKLYVEERKNLKHF